MKGRLAVATLSAFALSTRLPAQVQPDASLVVIPAGTPIRVWTNLPEMSKRTAVVVTAARDSFRIALDYPGYTTPVAVPYSALERVDWLVPRSRSDGALRGFGIGLLSAVVVDGALAAVGASQDGDTQMMLALVGVVSTPVLIVGGTIVGAVNPGERWSVVYRRPLP